VDEGRRRIGHGVLVATFPQFRWTKVRLIARFETEPERDMTMLDGRIRSGTLGVLPLAAALTLAAGSGPAAQALTPFSVVNVSEALMRAYNDEDAATLHGLLAPALQARYAPADLRTALTLCRVLTGDILRLSTPSWGERSYGFFGVYAETGVFDMVLEIDPSEKIVHWVIAGDVTASEQQCRIGATGEVRRLDGPVR
jgi:hypothetical protein